MDRRLICSTVISKIGNVTANRPARFIGWTNNLSKDGWTYMVGGHLRTGMWGMTSTFPCPHNRIFQPPPVAASPQTWNIPPRRGGRKTPPIKRTEKSMTPPTQSRCSYVVRKEIPPSQPERGRSYANVVDVQPLQH